MERQDFINTAGIGFLQGTLIGLLDDKNIPHKVTLDGMFGPATIEGLELAVRIGWRVQLPSFVDDRTFTSNDVYLRGVEAFQKWYKHTRDYMIANHEKKASIWAPITIDGKWGDKTMVALLVAVAALSR